MEIEIQVKKTKVENTFDNGTVAHLHTLEMKGGSADGELVATLVLKSYDPNAIKEVIPMIEGLTRRLALEKVNHTLDQYITTEDQEAYNEVATALDARTEAAKAKGTVPEQ